jgi:hypothetical protein
MAGPVSDRPQAGSESEFDKTDSHVEISAISSDPEEDASDGKIPVPLAWKLASILIVSAIGFGSHWSSGITGAMKSKLKKVISINTGNGNSLINI